MYLLVTNTHLSDHQRLFVMTPIAVLCCDVMRTHFSKRDVQPGTNPGSLVNHSRVIRMKKTPVTTSG